MNENTIWGEAQNHPELVVIDLKKEFNLSEKDCEKVRFILMRRGINKWLAGRRLYIRLKHDVKVWLREEKNPIMKKRLNYINERMQNVAKLPRWIEFPKTVYKDWRRTESEIVLKGRKSEKLALLFKEVGG